MNTKEQGGTRLLYVSDLHGSTSAWKRACRLAALRLCDALIVGGDWLGKRLVYHVPLGDGTWLEKEGRAERKFSNATEKEQATALLSGSGVYVVDTLNGHSGITEKMVIEAGIKRLNEWLSSELATPHEFTLILGIGNDDPEAVEKCLISWSKHPRVVNVFEEPVVWQGICMVGMACIPPSPWHTYRECSEEEIYRRISTALESCDKSLPIYLLAHAPPYGTSIDIASEIDAGLRVRKEALKPVERHVGSKSVRSIIESGLVTVGLHGHIHERSGVDWIKDVPVCNPGSQYWTGILQGYLISMSQQKEIHFRRVEVS